MSFISTRSYSPAPQSVADRVRETIRARALHPGDLLPTYETLCKDLGFSYVTVKRGMDLLEAEGLVRRIPSKGSFIIKEISRLGHELTNLGLIFSGSRDILFRMNYLAEIMRGVLGVSQPKDIDLHIFSLNDEGLVLADQLSEAAVDGVLLLNMENDVYLRAFAQWGTPGVVIDYCSSAVPLDFVACDNQAGAERVVEYLAGLGHRRIVYIDGVPMDRVRYARDAHPTLLLRSSSDVMERREGVVAALEACGIPCAEAVIALGADAPKDSLRIIAEQWRGEPDRATVFLTYDEQVALELIRQLVAQGVRVPEDVSVCAVAGAGDAHFNGRPLTLGRFDFIGMGRRAVALLGERCRAPEEPRNRIHRIGFKFVEGATTTAPSG